jgi:hypothetical protein
MKKKKIQEQQNKKYEILRDRLIEARRFHYTNFSKWMTYFYVAVGALFVGYYTIAAKENSDFKSPLLEYSVILLGYIVSLFWYWSAKGYYYWNINFISLVNEIDKKFPVDERIHFVFADKNAQNNYTHPIFGANISTSKISILFAFIITCFWGVFGCYSILGYSFYEYTDKCILFVSFLCSVFITVVLSSTVPKLFLKSNLDLFPDLKNDRALQQN